MGLSPKLRIIDLSASSGDGILAYTTNVVNYSCGSELNKVGPFSASVPAGDPGDATMGNPAFAEALLKAAGNSPKPLLISLSLDGGSNWDSHRLVRNPLRTLNFQQRVIEEAGSDIGDALSLAVIERATFTAVSLEDALNGIAGSIVSASPGGIRHTSTIPYLAGLLTKSPAAGMGWQAGLSSLLQFSGTINPSVSSVETNVDVDAATVLSALTTVVNRLAGSASSPYLGNFVIDPSDAALNLSSTVDFVATPAANSVVVGHYPTSSTHLTFDATGSADVDEVSTARVHLDQASIQSDDSTLYKSVNFVGGKNIVGIPEDAKIHGMAMLNGSSATMSGGSQWYDALLTVGLSFGDDAGGGIYFLHQDGLLRPIPGSPVMPVHSLAFDEGYKPADTYVRNPGLIAGSKNGVWYSTSISATNFHTASTWVYLDGLNADVVKIQSKSDPDNHDYPVIFALAKGKKERSDAIWRWAYDSTAAVWKWNTVLDNQAIVDFVSTDYGTVWVVEDKPVDHLYRWQVQPDKSWKQTLDRALPNGGTIRSVHEVITVSPALDSVWVLLDGDQSGSHKSPAYYTWNDSGTWSSLVNANLDDTIIGPSGEACMAHSVVGMGITFDPAIDSGTLVSAFLSTNQGALWSNNILSGIDPDAPAGSVYADITGNGYDLTLVGSPGLTSHVAGITTGTTAPSFADDGGGFTDALKTTTTAGLPYDGDSFTIEGWINSSSTNWQQLIAWGPPQTIGGSFMGTDFRNDNFGAWDMDDDFERNTGVTLNDSSWHHLVYTNDTSTAKIYVDGTLTNTNSVTGTYGVTHASTDKLMLGDTGYWFGPLVAVSSEEFVGAISHYAIYPSILDATQVSAHYAAMGGTESAYRTAILADSPTAFWPLTESGTTTAGVSTPGVFNWKRVALAGLDNYAIEQLTSSEAVYHQGVHLNPMYAVSADDILVSYSSGRYWRPLKGKDRTDLGVHLSDITLNVTSDLPDNAIVTWGTKNPDGSNMTTSPLGLASSTHIYVPTGNPYAVPQGQYWHRYQDDHQDYQYELVSMTMHMPGVELAQLPELQTNTVVSGHESSKAVAIVARRFLGQHSQPVLHLTLQSSFEDTLSALRTLRASHKVALVGSINITDISSAGVPVTTHVMDFDGTEDLWVLSHTIKKGPGMTAVTTTTISNRLLETPPTPQDMANSLTDSIHSLKTWR